MGMTMAAPSTSRRSRQARQRVRRRRHAQLRPAPAGRSPGCSPRRPDVVPIPGTRRTERLEENVGAAAIELTDADLERIHAILPDGSFGERYAAGMMPAWD
jgi:aryl-alcohol dehydrogenase-like predicted oxidoreductase